MQIGNRTFDLDRQCYVMGILNVTPDSFSDGGLWNDLSRAEAHVAQMLEEGADLIDVGGESIRPGHVPVSAAEEMRRVLPSIRMIKEKFDVPVSIDTYKAEVAAAALEAGADLVNDVWGLRRDPEMAPLIADRGVPCCLMHNRTAPVTEGDFMTAFLAEMQETADAAVAAGIRRDRILLDPGVGFGKTHEQNLTVIRHLDRLRALGYPVLLATSRKSVIGNVLDLPVDQRLEGTLVTTVIGVLRGACFVRVHDVAAHVRAIRMLQALLAAEA